MWKLTIEDDEQKQTSLPLAHDEYGIGRDETNSIRLTDRNISRRHLVLVRNAEGWIVRDLQSYNGTYVNGNRVAGEMHIAHGDSVQLGDYRLELSDERKVPQPTLIMETSTQQAVAAPAPTPQHQRPDRLVVVVGPQPGQEFPLDKEKFSIGRSEEATISINHSSVSRLHAELFAIGGGRYEIIDKQSANGIRINGQEVRRGLLEAGDALELGDVRLRFVGAGKVFRGVLDRQMALPAIVGFEGVSGPKAGVRPAQKEGGVGKIVVLGVGIGILAVLGAAAFMHFRAPKRGAQPDPSAIAAEDKGKDILAQAKALADNGDLETAHTKIQSIPASSPTLDDPMVKDIEGKWADMLFDEFSKSTDPDERKALVYRIAATPTVDPDRRNKALAQLKEIDPEAEDPLTHPNQPVPTWHPPATGFVPGTSGSTFKPPPSGSSKPIDKLALDDPQAAINQLKPRLGSGTLTERDLRYLLSLCIQKSDAACRDKASAELSKLKKQKGN